MRKLSLLLAALVALSAIMVGSASSTTEPTASVTLLCEDGIATAVYDYEGFSPQNNLTATQTLEIDGVATVSMHQFSGPGSSDALSGPLPTAAGTYLVEAATVVVGGGGNVKAEASASAECTIEEPPPPPPPPPPPVPPPPVPVCEDCVELPDTL